MNTIFTDAPEVRAICLAAFPDYSGRKFSVDAFHGPRRIISMWSGGSRDTYALVNILTLQTIPIGQGIGDLDELPAGAALVQHTIFNGRDLGCRVHVHPENLTPLLGTGEPSLPVLQMIVLCATRCYKPSYAGRKNNRWYEANNYTGISIEDYEAAKESLISSGHLNKAGAITNKGRNTIGDTRMESLASELRESNSRPEIPADIPHAEHFTGEVNAPTPKLASAALALAHLETILCPASRSAALHLAAL